jgi:hypothetical protein
MSLVKDTLEYLRSNGYSKAEMNGYHSIMIYGAKPTEVGRIMKTHYSADTVITKEGNDSMVRLYANKNLESNLIIVDLPSRLVLYRLISNVDVITDLDNLVKLLNLSINNIAVSWYDNRAIFVTSEPLARISEVNRLLEEQQIFSLSAIGYMNNLTFRLEE